MLKLKLPANILLFSIFGFFLVFILWASLAELDEVTRATGRIVPSKQIQVIQNQNERQYQNNLLAKYVKYFY